MAITRRQSIGPNGELLISAHPDESSMVNAPTDLQRADDASRDRTTPREASPNAAGGPPTLAPPAPPAPPSGPAPVGAPSRPMTPTPVAAGMPQPFTPMPSMSTQSASTQPGGLSSIFRRGIAPSGNDGMLGRAGGLLGGGLGVPDMGGGSGQQDDLGGLIAALFKMASGGR